MPVTADQVVVELVARTSAHDAKIANAAKQFESKMATMAAAAERAGKATSLIGTNSAFDKFAPQVDKVGKNFNSATNNVLKFDKSISVARQNTGNLAAQFNDIGVQLAGGQSPFLIALQQGTQINQVLASMQGGGGVGALRALGGAFMSLLSPVSLATIAIIALGGAAVQYFAELIAGTQKSEKQLKQEAALVQKVAEKWGDALPALKAYAAERDKLADRGDIETAGNVAIDAQYEKLRKTIKDVNIEVADLVQTLSMQGDQVAPELSKLQKLFGDLSTRTDNATASVKDLDAVQQQLIVLQRTTGLPMIADLIVKLGDMRKAYLDAATAAAKLKDEQNALRVSQQLADNPSGLGSLSPLFSGGGQFLDRGGLQQFNFDQNALREAGASAAADMVRGFEGFIDKAKWDRNAFRVGFGSDTITRANGQIEKVTQDTVTTLEDAQRDLSRRLMEFQSGIQKAVGIETWKSFNEAQQAALTSIAYNYGSLPKRIVSAIQSGGGPEAVARAIAGLGSDNGGINRNRRNDEAQAFLSGSGISLKEAGVNTGKAKEPKLDDFERALQRTKEQTLALQAGAEAQESLTGKVTDYGFAVAKAQKEQELLNAAQREGKIATADLSAATPEMRKQIEETANAYASATAARNQLTDANKRAQETANEFKNVEREALGGFISDLRNGVSAADALKNALNRVLDSLINIALNGLFKSGGLFGGGGGGLLGGMIIPGILHDGGTVGSDGYGHGRSLPGRTWAGAKRMHNGGMALLPGEVPAILQQGEKVIPRGAKGSSTGSSFYMPVSIDARNADAAGLARVEKAVSELGRNVPKMVDARINRRNTRKDRA